MVSKRPIKSEDPKKWINDIDGNDASLRSGIKRPMHAADLADLRNMRDYEAEKRAEEHERLRREANKGSPETSR